MRKSVLAGSALAALAASPRPRALIGTVRADASDPKALIAQLNGAFEEFKATQRAAAVKSKVDDVLLNEKIDTINAPSRTSRRR
jgi:hypothetical protein